MTTHPNEAMNECVLAVPDPRFSLLMESSCWDQGAKQQQQGANMRVYRKNDIKRSSVCCIACPLCSTCMDGWADGWVDPV